MAIIKKAFFIFFACSLNPLIAEPVPKEHQAHCQKWEKGKCIKGALTEFALLFKNNIKNRSNACDKVCEEGCPSCTHCGFCGLCAVYSNEACVGVPYYTDRETCSVEKTKNCCDLCRVQCKSSEGVCSKKGFCNGGGAETDILTYCTEKTSDQQCMPCEQ